MRGLSEAKGSWKIICASPAKRAQSAAVERQQVVALEAHLPGGRLDQPQHQPADRRLAAAGLADERQRLAGLDREARRHRRPARCAVGRPNTRARARRNASTQASDLEQRRAHAHQPAPSGARQAARQRGRRRRRPAAAARRGSVDRERAARRRSGSRPAARVMSGTRALDRRQPLGASGRAAGSSQQPDRVGMLGLREQRRRPARARRSRPAYITATSSPISATTPRSWVIRMMAVPVSRLQLAHQVEDLRLDGDVERRGRLVGDQQCGSQASAMAIITRWRMPPESWCG